MTETNGQWAAFSPDGQRLLACAATIAELAERLRANNEDIQDVILEHVQVDDDAHLGGAELT
ncbi:MAG: hypothetical protein U0793_16610 [Gemmataceae bacterium]